MVKNMNLIDLIWFISLYILQLMGAQGGVQIQYKLPQIHHKIHKYN